MAFSLNKWLFQNKIASDKMATFFEGQVQTAL